MKAMVLVHKGKLELQSIPVPELNPEGVIAEVEAAAICNTTDLRVLDADDPTKVWPNQPWPLVLGHEVCGRVVDVGSQVKGWSKGDRIAGWCPPYGGFAEYCQMYPAYMAAVRPPDNMPAYLACLFELAIGTTRYLMPEQVRQVVENGKSAIVIGLGPSGLLYVRELVLMGVKNVFAADPHLSRRKLASALGASEVFDPVDNPLRILADRGVQVDVAIDTTGKDILDDLLRVIRSGGALVPFGVGWDLSEAAKKSATRGVVLSFASLEEGRAAAALVMGWMCSGELRADEIVTRRIRLEDLPDAFDRIRRREDIKIVVEMG